MSVVMRAISLWQPWGSLWLSEKKVHETRHWSTKHRGWLVVHAAKRRDKDLDDTCRGFGLDPVTIARGAIIGAVDLVGCHLMRQWAPEHSDDMEAGNWSDERFAWRRGRYVVLPTPILYKGHQGFFDVPADAIEPLLDLIPAMPASIDPAGVLKEDGT